MERGQNTNDVIPGWPSGIGPVGAALILALVSVVPIASSFQIEPAAASLANEGWVKPPIDWHLLTPTAALSLAVAVLMPSALIAGWLGGIAWRRYEPLGVLAAITVAWVLGIVLLPIAAAVLGLPLQSGIVCLFGCEAMLRDDQPLSGLFAYGQLVLGGLIVDAALFIPAVFFAVGRFYGWFIVWVLAVVGAHAVVHSWALTNLTTGGRVPYACLAIGVVLWAYWMRRTSRRDALISSTAPPA